MERSIMAMQSGSEYMGDTSIRVSEELADELWQRKQRGDSYEDVIWRLIEAADSGSVPDQRDETEDVTEERPQQPETAEDEPTEEPHIQAGDALAGWRHGRNAEEREASEKVALQATEWLRETPLDSVRKADVPLDELADSDPEDRASETLWTEVITEAWKHVVDRGFVEKPHSRSYRWVGEPDE